MKKIGFFSEKGIITLTELMIMVVIMGIISFIAVSFYINQLRSISIQIVKTEATREAIIVRKVIEKALVEADSDPALPNLPPAIDSHPSGGVFNWIRYTRKMPVQNIQFYQETDPIAGIQRIIKEVDGQRIVICHEGAISLTFVRPDFAKPKEIEVSVCIGKRAPYSKDFILRYSTKALVVIKN